LYVDKGSLRKYVCSMVKEVYNKTVDAYIEYPVDKAVTALNKFGVFTCSSGFHSHFDEKRFGLKPCWCILAEGRIKKEVKTIAERCGLKMIEVYPVKDLKKWLITIIYLPWQVAIEKNGRKAKNIFERFAEDLNAERRKDKISPKRTVEVV
jgi:hypothetical protein